MDNREKALDEFFKKNDGSVKKKPLKDTNQDESEKINSYFETVSSQKTLKKRSGLDKLVDFFRITSFKNKFDEKKVSANLKQIEVEGKDRTSNLWKKITLQFLNWFSFEAGVDILDETSVLYRRNLVIKHIIYITNIVFIIFTFIGSKSNGFNINLIVAFAFSLIMFFTNLSIKKIIFEEPRTLQKQIMGEYFSGIYILMMAMIVYIKLKWTLSSSTAEGYLSITQAGYSLIYFALVVLALYQDSKLLKTVFKIAIVLMTIIHVTVLYPVYLYGDNGIFSVWTYVKGPILTDIVLRTLVLAIFMIALYSTAKISEDMNNKRKEELIKRRAMEKDFKEVVNDVFDVIGVYKHRGHDNDEVKQLEVAHRVAEIASKLGNFLGYSPKLCKEIFDFSTIHIDKKDVLSLTDYDEKEVLDEQDFKKIRDKTIIGSIIIKRLQLEKKGEDIVRAHFEKTADADFISEMNSIQNNRESQVILLAEIYDILRQTRNYKKEIKHARAIDLIQLEFYPYFDPQIIDRFVKYSDDFESIYYKLTLE
ncbi:MAG: hypothetical protein PHC62_01270 [Candidatus Izemoplasmatales bacterium]|nr:hypothetical protein [Candidatus Izemoplasmatales bacterium]